jgi:hypothetical protein
VTDVNNAGTVREILLTTTPAGTLSALAREVLLASPTAVVAAGLVREVLLSAPPVITGGQTAVSINTG